MSTPPAAPDAVRHEALQTELQYVAAELRGALERFCMESGLGDMATHEPANPRQRLERVLTVSDDAAHRTADLMELSFPLAEQTGASAAAMLSQWRGERAAQSVSAHAVESFLDQTVHNMRIVGSSLSEVLLTHGYQEHGGKVLRGMIRLITVLETTLQSLQQLTGSAGAGAGAGRTAAPPVPTASPLTTDTSAAADDAAARERSARNLRSRMGN
jgi:chemotaxis protein CheZ